VLFFFKRPFIVYLILVRVSFLPDILQFLIHSRTTNPKINVLLLQHWCGKGECKRTPKSLDLVKIRTKSLEIWAKSLKTFTKSLKI